MKVNTDSALDSFWKLLLSGILFFYVIIAAKNILIPIVFSLFLSIILNPLVSVLEKKKVNHVLSIILVLLGVMLLLSVGVYYISMQSKSLITDIPDLAKKLKSFIDQIGAVFTDLTGFSSADQLSMLKQNMDNFISSSGTFFTGALNATSNFLTFISIVPIYVFFILLYKRNFKKFLTYLDGKGDESLIDIGHEIQKMVYSYMSGLMIVITIIAVLNSVGLTLLSLDYAIFMGILSAVLTIIPYIGIILGALLPVLVALLTKDSLWYPLGVVAVFAFVQFLEGNFITPNIVGSKVNVNPLAAIIGLLVGGACWGIMGMILAIPLLGITQIIFRHFEKLKPYALLLSSQREDNKENGNDQGIKLNIKTLFKRKSKEEND